MNHYPCFANPGNPVDIMAALFARNAHGTQKREYTGEPYIIHPAEVAMIVATVPHTEAMLAASWLHDVAEDTGVTIGEIADRFGEEIAWLVDDLTDVSRPEDGNRAARKAIDLAHTAKACPQAKTIKLADLISNTAHIVDNDPGFARVYLPEKAALLEVLKEGDRVLWARAKEMVDAGMAKLGIQILEAA